MTTTCNKAPAGWYCTRSAGHSGPCAAWPLKPSPRQRFRNWLTCFKRGYHRFFPVGDTLGGDWVRCQDCWKLDEYLPRVHEPKGYK
jgi:hypothetical protein